MENKRELSMDEMDQVSGGEKIILRDGRTNVCVYCDNTDFISYGWSNEKPRGWRVECSNCHHRWIYDGQFWFPWSDRL